MTRLAAIALDWLQFKLGFLGDFSRLAKNTSDIRWLAVVIQENQDCSFHAGIAYRDEDSTVFFIDQAGHMWFRNRACREYGVFSIPNLKEEDAQYLAGFCGRIARAHRNGRIPYSFQFDPDLLFDVNTGRLSTTDSGAGFSCSTFVAAVFRSSGINLIRETTWPRDALPEDIEARQSVLDAMVASGQPELISRANELKSQIRTRRITPQQVAGACLQHRLPCGFRCATENGHQIAKKMA